jgi:hypothetical protein
VVCFLGVVFSGALLECVREVCVMGELVGAGACASVSVWAVVIKVCECATVVEVGVCEGVVKCGL